MLCAVYNIQYTIDSIHKENAGDYAERRFCFGPESLGGTREL